MTAVQDLSGFTGPPTDRHAYFVEDRTRFLAGGLGVVFRATAKADPDQPVAVKCFNPDVSDDRFEKLQERAAALQTVRHENLSQLLEVFVGPPFAHDTQAASDVSERFCVHRWVEGESMAEQCDDASPSDVLRWCRDLSAGLDHLHGHPSGPFAHRDIHPRNVIITPEGRAVLIDFDTIFVEAVGGTFTSALLQGTRFAPMERADGLEGAQRDDRWSLARTILYAFARNPSGEMRLTDARSTAVANLTGVAADPRGVVDHLDAVLAGRDLGSATALYRRLERSFAKTPVIPRSIRRHRRRIARTTAIVALVIAATIGLVQAISNQAPVRAASSPTLPRIGTRNR